GEEPAAGRNFLPSENIVNGPKVALVGWETWQSRFGGAPQVLGRPVVLDGDTYTIVGVLPRGLRLNRAADPPVFWLPALQSKYDQPQYHNRSFRVVGRLQPNVSAAQAQGQVVRAVRSITGDSALGARVEDWNRDQTHDSRGPLLIVLAASGLLLLIGCVNVAILTLGESASRAREFAARVALGAGAIRVVRQLLAESMMIAAAGAVAGAGLAWAFTHALVALAPPHVPGIADAGVNLRVLLFAIGCTACVAIIAGLAPGLTVLRASESVLLRSGAGQSARHARGTQQWLVATEIALSLVLLVGAALLSRSLNALAGVDPGFRPANLSVVHVAGPSEFNANDARRLAYFEEGVRRLAAIPGVVAVSAGSGVPFSGGSSSSPVAVDGRVYDKDHPPPHTEQRSVLPGYLAVLGMTVRAGRAFTAQDAETGELVAAVSEAAAHRDFPGESPLGRLVKYQGKTRRIVGVVDDVRSSKLANDPGPAIYVPLAQHVAGSLSFVIRSSGGVTSLAPSIRAALTAVDAGVAVMSIDPLPQLVASSYADERYRTVIVTTFAALAAILAAVGLYGVTVRAAARRRREVGIRIALGATAANVTRLVMFDTLRGVALGVVLGLPLALLAGNRLAPYLFRVAPNDPVIVGTVAALLATLAALSSATPARGAARANPREVLSGE
ncbi:MAG TPA: ABC transporter permease, partial [Gemmatimonadaceae bacterium]